MRSFALTLLLLSSGVQAGSVDGTLLVSATVVATCAIETSAVAGVNVACPQQQPFHVRLSTDATAKKGMVDTSPAQSFSGSRQLALAASDSDSAGKRAVGVDGNAVSGQQITLLTVSY